MTSPGVALSAQRTDARYDGAGGDKPVILIGGSPGTGKSTLAGDLSARLGFDHRLGTGFVRAVLQSESSPETEPELFSLTFESDDPVLRLERQAHRLHRAVLACVARARREGTSLIIEGSHLIPSLYAQADHDLFIVLAAPPPSRHLARLRGPTHSRRAISERAWDNVQRLEAYYRDQAVAHSTPTAVYEDLDMLLPFLEEHGLAPRRPTA